MICKSLKRIVCLSGSAILALTLSGNAHAVLAYATDATFEAPVTPATATFTGLGTSDFSWGVPLNATTNVSSLSFTGVNDTTGLPAGTFLFGQISFFNGTVTPGTFAETVDLSLSAWECDDDFGPCGPGNFDVDESAFDSLSISVINTDNTGPTDLDNADAFCITLFGDTDPTCAWAQEEGSTLLAGTETAPTALPFNGTGVFDLFASVGSINIVDIRPATTGLRVTQAASIFDDLGQFVGFDYNPNNNVIYVPEPAMVSLLGTGLVAFGLVRRKMAR